MWNTLRTLWGLSMETLKRIHESCNRNTLGISRYLHSNQNTWKVDRVYGLLTVVVTTFFPSASKNDETWWDPQVTKTVYLWDVMDDQDSHNTMTTLEATNEWTIWKTKDKEWSPTLQKTFFHPGPQHTQGQAHRMLGIQDQAWDGGEEGIFVPRIPRSPSNAG